MPRARRLGSWNRTATKCSDRHRKSRKSPEGCSSGVRVQLGPAWSFAGIQAAYAAHGVATYPLSNDKTPAVKAYDRIGAPYSAQLALRFSHAKAGGFFAGRRNKLTVVDIDSPDDRL